MSQDARARITEAVHELRQEIATGSFGPTWLMLDRNGEQLQRNMLGLDDAIPDSTIEETANSSGHEDAVVHAIIRIDGDEPHPCLGGRNPIRDRSPRQGSCHELD